MTAKTYGSEKRREVGPGDEVAGERRSGFLRCAAHKGVSGFGRNDDSFDYLENKIMTLLQADRGNIGGRLVSNVVTAAFLAGCAPESEGWRVLLCLRTVWLSRG
jgi:hypothetical protein